jgi:hypothetical protein
MILNDSSLFSNSADITTKEILKRYGDRAKAPTVSPPAVNSGKMDTYGDISSPTPQHSSSRDRRNSVPTAQRVDTDPNMATAWQNESSVRHVGSDGTAGVTAPPTLPYANPRASAESHGSPNRASMRNAAWDKQRAMGVA